MNILAPFTARQRSYLTRCRDAWFNVAEGGKRGGKNVLQTLAFCLSLEEHPNRLYLIAGVTTATARLNVMDCDGYGLMNYYEGRCRAGVYQNRDCLYVDTITGKKIILISGGGKAGDEKLIKGNSYGMAYITEANECTDVFIKEVFDRTISSRDRKIFHDLNPKAEAHWYYTGILAHNEKRQAEDPSYGYNYGHFTIADNMSVSDEQLKTVIGTYDKQTVWYQRDILGLRKQAKGLIYDMFEQERHVYTDASKAAGAGRLYIAVDYGTVNPAVFLDIWDSGDHVYVRREYYYDSQDAASRSQKTDAQYGEDMDRFVGKNVPLFVIVDPSAASFKAELRARRYRVKDADNDVIEGIRAVATLLSMVKLHIHASCVNLINELSAYGWDEKAASRGEERPVKQADHACDALRYFIQTMVDRRRFHR